MSRNNGVWGLGFGVWGLGVQRPGILKRYIVFIYTLSFFLARRKRKTIEAVSSIFPRSTAEPQSHGQNCRIWLHFLSFPFLSLLPTYCPGRQGKTSGNRSPKAFSPSLSFSLTLLAHSLFTPLCKKVGKK